MTPTGNGQGDPQDHEVAQPGRTYVVRAVRAGEPLRDYGTSGTIADLLVLVVEVISVTLRRRLKPGWVVGVILDRPRRPLRLVHTERLPLTADPAQRIAELSRRLSGGWRPKNL